MEENEKVRQMMVRVQQYLDIPIEKMTNGCRKPKSLYARHLFCYMCWHFKLDTLASMGKMLNIDHSTAHNGIKRIIEWKEGDRTIRGDINAMEILTMQKDHTHILNTLLKDTPPSLFPELLEHVALFNKKNNIEQSTI